MRVILKEKHLEKSDSELVISVESRKGGVGKTTAALCLARKLRKLNYSVLVIDLDVTGTNAADIATSPFWNEDLHVIQDASKEGYSLNILTLFEQCYLSGKNVYPFSTDISFKDSMTINLNKVNIMGSQIYKTDHNDKNSVITCIERPGILFDDLHSFWLLEFVKQLINNFKRTVCNTDSTGSSKIAIVLDNSPGYVGIAPTIHEWLTDLGPENGKFLTVASLDVQDLLACEMAIKSLHGLYEGKWSVSRLFKKASKPRAEVKIKKHQEQFFLRLATSSNANIDGGEALSFYKRENISDEYGEDFCINPKKYSALILNRVPRPIKTGQLEYEYPNGLDCKDGAIQRLFGGAKFSVECRKRMISYDEYIENQFLPQSFPQNRRNSERQSQNLTKLLKQIEHDFIKLSHDKNYLVGSSPYGGLENIAVLKELLSKSNILLGRVRSALETAGLGHLSRLIHDEWLPGSILPTYMSSLSKMMFDLDFFQFDVVRYDLESGSVTKEETDDLLEFRSHILYSINHDRTKLFLNEESPVNVLASYLTVLYALTLKSLRRSRLKDEMINLFSAVLAIELNHWPQKVDARFHGSRLQSFLSREATRDFNLSDEIKDLFRGRIPLSIMSDKDSGFTEFYHACAHAQARLIDFIEDSVFLVQLIGFMVKRENPRGRLFPYVKGIAEDVIINKSVSHEEAPRRMEKALQTAEYFREFDAVLMKVLADWGVKHG